MSDLLKAEGVREGISFAFEKIDRRPNTIDSHRLIRWAATAGIQDAVVERLFAPISWRAAISAIRVIDSSPPMPVWI